MDLGTAVGLVLIYVLLLSAMAMGVGLAPYLDIPSVLIVFGGTSGALLMAFKLDQLSKIGALVKIAFMPESYDVPALIRKIVDYATAARRGGILEIESTVNNEDNIFLKKGLSMAVDGNEPDSIRQLLEIEIEATSERHKGFIAIFQQMGGLAGAYGMIGTLIGLVAMLVNMDDPSSIGPAMAVAILTTLYGAMIGNTFAGPMANILGIRDGDEMLVKTLIVEGIMSIQAGDNPRVLEQKLLSFLPPSQRQSQFE